MLAERGPLEWDGDHIGFPLCRLEKEYAAMKSKEMEEQIEIKVSPQGGVGDRDRMPLGMQPGPSHVPACPQNWRRRPSTHLPLRSPAGRRVSKGLPQGWRPVPVLEWQIRWIGPCPHGTPQL